MLVLGYIYVLRLLDSPYLFTTHSREGCSYKIGKTTNRITRLKALGILLPQPAELIVTIPADVSWAEPYLHQKLANTRLNGEWFALTRHHLLWLISASSPMSAGLEKSNHQELENLFNYYSEYCMRDPE